ncbi:MAG: hypothetical protein ONB06_12060 [candidate division KSB1 bacterium]|nr:hypothetical protein [candidate division KSB1 bacterium]
MGRASEYLERKLGVRTRFIVNPVTDTVGTTVTQIALANPDRLALLIVNLSPYTVYVGFDRQVSETRGIMLGSGGSSVGFYVDEDLELVCGEVFAVSPDGEASIYMLEMEAS